MKRKMTEIGTSLIFSSFFFSLFLFSFLSLPSLSIPNISRAKIPPTWWWWRGRGGGGSWIGASAVDPPALAYSRHGNVNLPGAVCTSLLAEARTEVSPSLWAIEWITDSLSTEPCGSAGTTLPPLHHLPRVSWLQRCERCRRPVWVVVCLVLFCCVALVQSRACARVCAKGLR